MQEVPDTRRAGIKALPAAFILVSMVILGVTSSKYYVDPAVGFADEIATMTGHSFIIAAVSYLIWRFFQKKKGIGLLYFSIILLAVSSYRCVNMMEEVYTARRTTEQATAFAKEFKNILKNIVENEEVEPKMFDRRTYGELTPILQALNSYKVQLQKTFVELREEMKGPSLVSLVASRVKPENISSPKLIKEGKAKLGMYRSVLEKYAALLKEREQKLFQDLVEIITYSAIPHERKQELLTTFDSEAGNVLGIDTAKVFEIFISLIDETTGFLTFLEGKQGKYKVVGKLVLFESQEDADTYNNYRKEIVRISDEVFSEKAKLKNIVTQYTEQLEKLTK